MRTLMRARMVPVVLLFLSFCSFATEADSCLILSAKYPAGFFLFRYVFVEECQGKYLMRIINYDKGIPFLFYSEEMDTASNKTIRDSCMVAEGKFFSLIKNKRGFYLLKKEKNKTIELAYKSKYVKILNEFKNYSYYRGKIDSLFPIDTISKIRFIKELRKYNVQDSIGKTDHLKFIDYYNKVISEILKKWK